tara:strand:- start:35 stop:520 length:486 start_codon:yes stop_codon:yes gene_type:complete
MSSELVCEKRVVCDKEHQYWIDRTTPFPGMRDDVANRNRICNRFYDDDAIVNRNHIGEDQFISYYPYSRILRWCSWSIKAMTGESANRCHSRSKSKSKLANELSYFENCDPSIILDHFDKNSFWYWDFADSGYSDRSCYETIYDPKTGKSKSYPILELETA